MADSRHSIQGVLSIAHTFHNCHRNQCTASRTRVVRQECQETALRADEYLHTTHPEDLVLNLAKMRSAAEFHVFRSGSRYPQISLAELVPLAVSKRQQMNQATQTSTGNKRARANIEGAPSTPHRRSAVLSTMLPPIPQTPSRGTLLQLPAELPRTPLQPASAIQFTVPHTPEMYTQK